MSKSFVIICIAALLFSSLATEIRVESGQSLFPQRNQDAKRGQENTVAGPGAVSIFLNTTSISNIMAMALPLAAYYVQNQTFNVT
jgi:hypothetical protein